MNQIIAQIGSVIVTVTVFAFAVCMLISFRSYLKTTNCTKMRNMV